MKTLNETFLNVSGASFGELLKMGRSFARKSLFVAVTSLVFTLSLSVGMPELCAATPRPEPAVAKVLDDVRAAVAADPVNSDIILLRFMRGSPRIADKIAKAAFEALPRKNGQRDPHLLARLLKVALDFIYAGDPSLRREVSAVVLAAIEDLRGEDGVIDPKAVGIVLSAAFPVIFANDPGLIVPLKDAVLALVPDAAGILKELLAALLTPLNQPNLHLDRRALQVEPRNVLD